MHNNNTPPISTVVTNTVAMGLMILTNTCLICIDNDNFMVVLSSSFRKRAFICVQYCVFANISSKIHGDPGILPSKYMYTDQFKSRPCIEDAAF